MELNEISSGTVEHNEPVQEKPKNKGGRPKGSTKNKIKPNEQAAKQNAPNPTEELEKLRQEYASVKIEPDKPLTPEEQAKVDEAKKSYTSIITGMMLLTVCDFIFPTVIKFLFKKSKPKLEVKNLKMTSQEKQDLEPLADEAAKYLLSGMNPVQLFFLCMGATYFGKLQTVENG